MASSAPRTPAPQTRPATAVFDRVVCVVDRPRSSLAAARVAAHVRAPGTDVGVLTVEDGARPIGRGLDELLAELERRETTLVVVCIRERSRAVGIAAGSVATHLLHEAPCSVLVVPERELAEDWPASIAVALDGSVESAAAAAATWDLSRRLGAPVRAIAATGRPRPADLELVRRIAPDFEAFDSRPVTAIAEASEDADLVVVGSRGLRGIHALGSVSERVAHEAHCPVLVVRPAPRG